MKTDAYLLEVLTKKAKETKNEDVLNELQSAEFLKCFETVNNIAKKLDLNLYDSAVENDYNLLKDINFKISKTLISNYLTIYYVDTVTGEYVGYTSSDGYKALKIAEKGYSFFEDLEKNISRVIYEEDREYVRKNITKDKILDCIKNDSTYNMSYRLLINGEPKYVNLKILKLAESDNNVIIGISDIDELKKQELEMKNRIKKNITYTNIALALVRNFFTIYYVNTKNNEYEEYNLDSECQQLIKVNSGSQFFEESIVNAKSLIHKEDLDIFLNALNKDNLLNELSKNKSFRLSYRQIIISRPVYMSLLALSLNNDPDHILIGISNVDKQKKRELEFLKNLEIEKNIARTDALTGAKNKYSYGEIEKILNDKIKKNSYLEFSILVCDINNLKQINDTFGHAEGDKYIINAKNIISDIFKNSSIYRVGGDEFALILEGSDYYKREHLMKELNEINIKNKRLGNVVIASGIADFDKNTDDIIEKTFTRADELMYKNKEELKK